MNIDYEIKLKPRSEEYMKKWGLPQVPLEPWSIGGVTKLEHDVIEKYGTIDADNFVSYVGNSRATWRISDLEYVKNIETGEFYIKDGKWIPEGSVVER